MGWGRVSRQKEKHTQEFRGRLGWKKSKGVSPPLLSQAGEKWGEVGGARQAGAQGQVCLGFYITANVSGKAFKVDFTNGCFKRLLRGEQTV